SDKNRALPDTSPREKWILVTMAAITLWMGIGSSFFTRRFAASSQNVLDQMQRQYPQEALGVAPSEARNEHATVAAADRRGRLLITRVTPTTISQPVISSEAGRLSLPTSLPRTDRPAQGELSLRSPRRSA